MIYELKDNQKFFANKVGVSYRVVKGSLQVYLVPLSDNVAMRRLFLTTAREGDVIPFLHADWTKEGKGRQFALMLVANAGTAVEDIQFNSSHAYTFLEKANIPYDDEPYSEFFLPANLMFYYGTKAVEENKIIRNVAKREEREYAQSVEKLSQAFVGKKENKWAEGANTDSSLYNAMKFLCAISKIQIAPIEKIKSVCKDIISPEDIARLSGFLCREIKLEKGWESNDDGPFLIIAEDGQIYVVYHRFGLQYWNPDTGTFGKFKDLNLNMDTSFVYVLHKSLPNRKINFRDIFKFSMREIRVSDIVILLLASLLVTWTTLQLTTLNEILFSSIIPQGASDALLTLCSFILACMFGGTLFSIAKGMTRYRITSRVKYSLFAAIYDRLFHMPESYFRNKESAMVAYRVENVPTIYVSCFSGAVEIIIMAAFSTMYVTRMLSYSSSLTLYALLFVVISMIATIAIGYRYTKYQMQSANYRSKIRSFLFQTFGAIPTIRTYGSESNFSNRFMGLYSDFVTADLKSSQGTWLGSCIIMAISNAAIVTFYYFMSGLNLGISIAQFLAFLTAYAAFSASMNSVAAGLLQFIIMWPILKNSSDILAEVPENADDGIIPEKVNGDILISNLNYSYSKGAPLTLKNINMHISPGEYVAIVGPSGCGKSTLIRMLLGFDKPQSGKICFDGVDLERLNKTELRRKIGTVLQDGVLFSGSIYKNVKISCPTASEEDVREAVRLAAIEDEIENMPLKYSTPVSEQTQSISGGQKQRILIARAIVSKPSILILDEATSALDNLSQAEVCRNLDKLEATRVVIAHRLSTIQNCDRIFVMDGGQIVETGTYDELMVQNGLFYRLASRQTIN